MKVITKRELNQQTAQVLADVDSAGPVVVTERAVPRWRIDAVDAAADVIARLRAEGRIVPPKAEQSPWPRRGRRYSPADVDAIYAQSRGDR